MCEIKRNAWKAMYKPSKVILPIPLDVYGNADDPLVIDSEIIPPSPVKKYEFPWTPGHIETINVSSTISEGMI